MKKLASSLALVAFCGLAHSVSGQTVEAVLRALQERKQVLNSAERSGVESERRIQTVRGTAPEDLTPDLPDVKPLLQWPGITDAYPSEGSITDLSQALTALNYASRQFDEIKGSYLAYSVDGDKIVNQTYEADVDYQDIGGTLHTTPVASRAAHTIFPSINLPSVGEFTEHNWRQKIKLLASNINQLKALRWNVGLFQGFSGGLQSEGGAERTVYDLANRNFEVFPERNESWKSVPFAFPWILKPWEKEPDVFLDLIDKGRWGITSSSTAAATYSTGAFIGPYIDMVGMLGAFKMDLVTIGGVYGKVKLETRPPNYRDISGRLAIYRSYSVAPWGDLVEHFHGGGSNTGKLGSMTWLQDIDATSGLAGAINLGDDQTYTDHQGNVHTYLSATGVSSNELAGLDVSFDSEHKWSAPDLSDANVNPNKSNSDANGLAYEFTNGAGDPLVMHRQNYGWDASGKRYAANIFNTAVDAVFVAIPDFASNSDPNFLPTQTKQESNVPVRLGEVEVGMARDLFRIHAGRGQDLNQLGWLTGRADGFGSLFFNGSPNEFEVLYQDNYTTFTDSPIGGKLIDGLDASFGNHWADAGWFERFNYIIAWHSPRLRQVKGSDILVDITYPNIYEKNVKFYWLSQAGQKTGGFYQPTGNPFKSITVKNPTVGGIGLPTEHYHLRIQDDIRFHEITVVEHRDAVTHSLQSEDITFSHSKTAAGTECQEVSTVTYGNDAHVDTTIHTSVDHFGVVNTIDEKYRWGFSPRETDLPVLFQHKMDGRIADYTWTKPGNDVVFPARTEFILNQIDFSQLADFTWDAEGATATFTDGVLSKLRRNIGTHDAPKWLETTWSVAGSVATTTDSLDGTVFRTVTGTYTSGGFVNEEIRLDGVLQSTLHFVNGAGDGGTPPWSLKSTDSPNGYQEKYTYTTSNGAVDLDVKAGWDASFICGTHSTLSLNRFGGLQSSSVKTTDGVALSSSTTVDHTPWGAPKDITDLRGFKRTFVYNETGANWGTLSQTTSPDSTISSISDYDWLGRPTKVSTDFGEEYKANFTDDPLTPKWKKDATATSPVRSFENQFNSMGELIRSKSTADQLTNESLTPIDGNGSLTIDGLSKSIIRDRSGFISSTTAALGSRGVGETYGVDTFNGHPCRYVESTQRNKADESNTPVVVRTYFDGLGRVIGVTHPSPNGGTVTETWTYDDPNRTVTHDPGAGPVVKPVTSVTVAGAGGDVTTITSDGFDAYKITRGTDNGGLMEKVEYKDDTGTGGAVWKQLSKTRYVPSSDTTTSIPFDFEDQAEISYSSGPSGLGTSTRTFTSAATGDWRTDKFDHGLLKQSKGKSGGVAFDIDSFDLPGGHLKGIKGKIAGSANYNIGFTLDDHQRVGSTLDLFGTTTHTYTQSGGGWDVTSTGPDAKIGHYSVDHAGDLKLSDVVGQVPALKSVINDIATGQQVKLKANGYVDPTNQDTTITLNAAGAVTSKVYGSNALTESASYNSDGSLASYSISGSLGSASASFTYPTSVSAVADYSSGPNIATTYFKAGPRKEVTQTLSDTPDHRTFHYQNLNLSEEKHLAGPWTDTTVTITPDSAGFPHEISVTGDGFSRTFTLLYEQSRFKSSSTNINGGFFTTEVSERDPNNGGIRVVGRWGAKINGTAAVRSYDSTTKLFNGVTHATGSGFLSFSYPTRDSRGRITSRISNATDNWSAADYSDNGQLHSMTYPGMGATFTYQHDARGNRRSQDRPVATSPPNALDQLTGFNLGNGQRFVGVFGKTAPGAEILLAPETPETNAPFQSVGVKATADSHGFYSYEEPVSDAFNASSFSVFDFKVTARRTVSNQLQTLETPARALIPGMTDSFQYDVQGQLIADGHWLYTWDGAGRLTHMHSLTNGPAPHGGTFDVDYEYDADGRRIGKVTTTVFPGPTQNDPTVYHQERSAILYVGWLPILERRWVGDSLSPVDDTSFIGSEINRRWFQWGADRSDSLDGAGGIGGLAAIHEETSGGQYVRTLLPVDDGLGNIVALLDGPTGNTIATYRYGPFGENLGETGESDACPFRWQTKWYDSESKHYYFGYRHYDPRVGRWLSRDPLGEAGGFNRYAYCGNDPINGWDYLGLVEKLRSDWEPGIGLSEVARINPIHGNPEVCYGYTDSWGGYLTGKPDSYYWAFPDSPAVLRMFFIKQGGQWALRANENERRAIWQDEAAKGLTFVPKIVKEGLKQQLLFAAAGGVGTFAGLGVSGLYASAEVGGYTAVAGTSMASGFAGDLTYQGGEMAFGDRDSIDVDQLMGATAISGILGTTFHGISEGLGKFSGPRANGTLAPPLKGGIPPEEIRMEQAMQGPVVGTKAIPVDGGYEIFYRSMSKANFQTFLKTGRIPATTETFISPTLSFSEDYQGVLVKFQVSAGTTGKLRAIGVRANGSKAAGLFPDLPEVRRRWGRLYAQFKPEGDQINIGLGTGRALDLFNDAIRGFEVLNIIR